MSPKKTKPPRKEHRITHHPVGRRICDRQQHRWSLLLLSITSILSITSTAQVPFETQLTQLLPNWREIDQDPAWWRWISQPCGPHDVYASAYIRKAFDSMDAPLVAFYMSQFQHSPRATPKLPRPQASLPFIEDPYQTTETPLRRTFAALDKQMPFWRRIDGSNPFQYFLEGAGNAAHENFRRRAEQGDSASVLQYYERFMRAQEPFFTYLSTNAPNWKKTEANPAFHKWLQHPFDNTNLITSEDVINDAYDRLDPRWATAIYMAYTIDTIQLPPKQSPQSSHAEEAGRIRFTPVDYDPFTGQPAPAAATDNPNQPHPLIILLLTAGGLVLAVGAGLFVQAITNPQPRPDPLPPQFASKATKPAVPPAAPGPIARVTTRCDHCRNTHTTTPEAIGKRIPCPRCNHTFLAGLAFPDHQPDPPPAASPAEQTLPPRLELYDIAALVATEAQKAAARAQADPNLDEGTRTKNIKFMEKIRDSAEDVFDRQILMAQILDPSRQGKKP